jgi:hypothetical protein
MPLSKTTLLDTALIGMLTLIPMQHSIATEYRLGINPIQSSPLPLTTTPAQPPTDDERVGRMSDLLKQGSADSYEKYAELCKQATTQPKIGMTVLQSRATTWCFPASAIQRPRLQANRCKKCMRYLYWQDVVATVIAISILKTAS